MKIFLIASMIVVFCYIILRHINSFIGHKNNKEYEEECKEDAWLKDYTDKHCPDSDYKLTYEELIKKQEDGTITANQASILKCYQERDNKLMHKEDK